MVALPYHIPKIYNFFLCLWEKENNKKYRIIAEMINKNKKVFELGCGTAILADYLDKSCSYIGWDLNDKFVNYCRAKKLNVYKKNIFDFNEYPQSDVIVISDVLHHIVPQDKMLVREARKRTKTLIVTEPISGLSCKNIPFALYRLYDKILGDNDGINDLENRKKWGFTNQKEVVKYLKRLGFRKIIFYNKEKFIAV